MSPKAQSFCGWLFTAFTADVSPRDLKAWIFWTSVDISESVPVDKPILEAPVVGLPIASSDEKYNVMAFYCTYPKILKALWVK